MTKKQWDDIIKALGPAVGGIALAGVGCYGGYYAKLFKSPYDDWASVICLIAMGWGLLLAGIQISVKTFRQVTQSS